VACVFFLIVFLVLLTILGLVIGVNIFSIKAEGAYAEVTFMLSTIVVVVVVGDI
jgi:hypothetical protein